jgi:hypothetical protein
MTDSAGHDTEEQQYDVPSYHCEGCDTAPRLMADRTAVVTAVGVGCDCTVENGRPFVALGSSAMQLPERWSLDV